jgi:hypothetical protein
MSDGTILEDEEIKLMIRTPNGRREVHRLMRMNRASFAAHQMLNYLHECGLVKRNLDKDEMITAASVVYTCMHARQDIIDDYIDAYRDEIERINNAEVPIC